MPSSDIASITAVILAGGFGTRLKSVLADKPKVMADIGSMPFIFYIFDQFLKIGIHEAVVCTGYQAEKIQSLGSNYGKLNIRYSREYEPLGTGGALRLSLPHINSEVAMVMNGDSYIAADLNEFINWFFEKDRSAAILLSKVDDVGRFGKVTLADDNSVISFEEKTSLAGCGWINAGAYLLKKTVIESIPCRQPYSLEKQLFPSMINKGLYGCCLSGEFIDIGTPESYGEAEEFFRRLQIR